MTARVPGRRGVGSSVLGWLRFLILPGALAAQSSGPLVLTREALERSGRTQLSEILPTLLPSFNAPRPSIAGGSDFVRPATLSGLGADQIVVLINGKRRHPSALLNLDQSIGRGEGMTDLDAIPLAALERVEVYREGDAARFGFGAVTGVINLVLRSAAPAAARAELGRYSAGDGTLLWADGAYSVPLGHGGFVQLSGELSSRGATNRALPDRRPQYFAGDPRNSDPALSNRVDQRYGEPELQRVTAFVNIEQRLPRGVLAYGFADVSRASGEAGELWRQASDDRTVRALYPNGFLPLLTPKLKDGSLLGGARGRILGGSWDASLGYGRNSFRYELEHSANVSLGPQSPTEFTAGTLRSDLLSVELRFSRRIRLGPLPPILVSLGGEHRSEGYQIQAGEPDSYRFGAVPIQDGPHAGNLAPVGAQGFPGFQPGDAITKRRGMLAANGELSGVFFQRLSLAAAGRVEDYPEFPARGVYQLSAELGRLHGVRLWASYGTAVRVPALAQSWFSSTSILVSGNLGFAERTVPVSDRLGIVLGSKPLRAERSRHWSEGITLQPLRALTLSAAYSHIGVDDRIILSGKFADPAIGQYLAQQGFFGIQSVRFFANALGTRTTGMDVSAAYRFGVGDATLRLSLALSHQRTRVTLTDSVPGLLARFTSVFFDRVERARLERGQPRDKVILAAQGERARWTLDARIERFGSVTSFGAPADGSLDQTYGAKWLSELS
ncbi:MAG TPA: TonB-dependent receptor, partial [Gemmatimonadales bacterium]|nr:TonB-dependent receptor [Gemmatimonadales bacterium]